MKTTVWEFRQDMIFEVTSERESTPHRLNVCLRRMHIHEVTY